MLSLGRKSVRRLLGLHLKNPPEETSERAKGRVTAIEEERFIDQLEPGNTAYYETRALRFETPVDAGLLKRVFQEIVGRHEALRARAMNGTRRSWNGAVRLTRSVSIRRRRAGTCGRACRAGRRIEFLGLYWL